MALLGFERRTLAVYCALADGAGPGDLGHPGIISPGIEVGNPDGSDSTLGMVGSADGKRNGAGGASASRADGEGGATCPDGTGRGGDGEPWGGARVGPSVGTSLGFEADGTGEGTAAESVSVAGGGDVATATKSGSGPGNVMTPTPTKMQTIAAPRTSAISATSKMGVRRRREGPSSGAGGNAAAYAGTARTPGSGAAATVFCRASDSRPSVADGCWIPWGMGICAAIPPGDTIGTGRRVIGDMAHGAADTSRARASRISVAVANRSSGCAAMAR